IDTGSRSPLRVDKPWSPSGSRRSTFRSTVPESVVMCSHGWIRLSFWNWKTAFGDGTAVVSEPEAVCHSIARTAGMTTNSVFASRRPCRDHAARMRPTMRMPDGVPAYIELEGMAAILRYRAGGVLFWTPPTPDGAGGSERGATRIKRSVVRTWNSPRGSLDISPI